MAATAPLAIEPLRAPPDVDWPIPGSKSITNRALVLAALADGESRLENVLHSEDTHHMRTALTAMGIALEDVGETTCRIGGGIQRLRAPEAPLFVGNSGTTVRFVAALAALVAGPTTLTGDEHMARRPIGDLVGALDQLAIRVDCPTGCPPLTVHGEGLPGGRVHLRGDRSSQYFSALLMAGCAGQAPLEIVVEGTLVSRPYVEMTLRMIEAFGGSAAATAEGFRVRPASLRPCRYAVEPDASAASYPLALAAATGGRITVPGLRRDALQGDVAFAEVLADMGADLRFDDAGVTVTGPANGLRGIDVDLHHISDTVMTLAAIAPRCRGPTTIRNVANIRIKETDRLAALVTELERLGQGVTHGEDWLRIEPRPVTPAAVECYADHRIAMSFAVLGACTPGVTIADPACVAKTYPAFFSDLAAVYRQQGLEVDW